MTAEPPPAAEPSLVDQDEFCVLASMSPEAVATAALDGTLFGVLVGGRMYYPSFFADPRFDKAQVAVLCRLLGDLPAGSKWQFFSTRKGSLGGRTPLQAMLDGELAMVKRAAEGFRER